MLLGKRPRPPIKRTTSMTGITVDVSNMEAQEPSDHDHEDPSRDLHASSVDPPQGSPVILQHHLHQNMNGYDQYDQSFLAMVSPRNYTTTRRSNIFGGGGGVGVGGDDDFVDTAHFLRTCGLCQRRLAPGKDIYMYRGDTAFCSLECREQQMKQDERKERYTVTGSSSTSSSSKKKENHHASSPPRATKSSHVAAA